MTQFRYRHLTAVRDPEAIAAMEADFRAKAVRRREAAAAGTRAEAEAPSQILADESEGTAEDITRMLREGDLMPSDLVFSNGQWTTFDRSAEFFEACEGMVDTRERSANVKVILRAMLGVLAAAALIALRIWARH